MERYFVLVKNIIGIPYLSMNQKTIRAVIQLSLANCWVLMSGLQKQSLISGIKTIR